jgi:hypothetical protein
VSRHQLIAHPDVRSHPTIRCAVVNLENRTDPGQIFEQVRSIMADDFIEGSDPGIAIAREEDIHSNIREFGLLAKQGRSSPDGNQYSNIRRLQKREYSGRSAFRRPFPAS